MSSHIPGRKEGREETVQIREDERSGPQSLFTLSETLNLYLTNQKDFFFFEHKFYVARFCSTPEKCQLKRGSCKDRGR